MSAFKTFSKLLRIYQWTKSGFVFLPFVFSHHLIEVVLRPFAADSFALYATLAGAFLAFSFAASSVYIMNDLRDVELDRLDPRKSRRPIASGAVSERLAQLVMVLLLVVAVTISFTLAPEAALIVVGYFLLNVFYTYIGKRIILLDVFIIAVGYVLRVILGAYVLGVEASPWLLSTTLFISLFLGFFKRHYEVSVAAPEELIGGYYRSDTLRYFISITASLSIVTYTIYTILGPHAEAHLLWTIPLVVLGIFRYFVLLQSPEEIADGNPSDVLLADRFLIVTIAVWLLLCAALILYFEAPLVG